MNLVKLFFMARFNVIQFVSPYKKANTYIVEINSFDVIIIDLGNYPIVELVKWLKVNNKKLIGLFLTHEHSDHCYGVDHLRAELDFTLYCSKKCEINMRNPKQNLSRYIEEFKTFGVESEATIVEDGQVLIFNGFEITIIETPGHSPGGVCILMDEIIFSGDTLLNNVKSPLCFPHSAKRDFQESEKKILKYLTPKTKIYPGHGNPFYIEC